MLRRAVEASLVSPNASWVGGPHPEFAYCVFYCKPKGVPDKAI